MKQCLKLFVWEDVLTAYSSGIMVALAENVDQARSLLLKECDYIPSEDLAKEPKIVTKLSAFLVWGGG